ncbi:MAG: tetratricopeptide repeat protein, partial [Pyrinomonadaceae bacterium]
MQGLIVRPLSATRKYSDIDQDATLAGKEQQVDYVLASNYQTSNGKIRLTAQLINVQTGLVEEVFRDEEDSADIFAMQDAIAAKVENLLLTLLNIERGSITAKNYKTNEEAYRLYVSGLYQWNRRTGASLQKAAEYFNQAVKIDPNYARAFSGIANCYALFPTYEVSSPSESFPKAKEAAEKALALDENLAEAHTALAFVLYHYEANWERAESEFKRAVLLDPNYATAHHWYGEYLGAAGRFDEAFAEQRIALMLDPQSFIINMDLGWNFYMARRYDKAIVQY